VALLIALVVGAATIDRATWPTLVGDEATYLMAAESLAFDGDYRYTAGDFERFRQRWKVEPEGLILQRGRDGALFYGKPVLWPAYAAPFVTVFGRQGPFIANAFALSLAALCAALALTTRTGPWAPTWIAAHLFGTVVFAWVFWAHSDLLSMALVALALAAVMAAELRERERNRFSRPSPFAWLPWCFAGALMAAVIWSRPPYAVLLLPVIVALPPRRRRRTASAFVLGAVLVSGGLLWSQSSRTGSYSAYGGERRSFYAHTGWPDVGPGGAAARARFDDSRDDAAWEGPAGAVEVARWGADRLGWNLLYTLVGRHVGLLPYFSAVLLLFIARPRGALAWSLVAAFGLAALFFALNRPLNFWGGGGSLANRYLMPLLPALWFVPTRVTRPWAAAAVALVAAPFLWPLWVAPRAAPYGPDGTYRWVTPAAKALLPYETTQSHLKPAGIEDIVHHNLWVKFLDRGVLPLDDSLTCPALVRGHLLLGSAQPVSVLRLSLTGADPTTTVDLAGATQLRVTHSGGIRSLDLEPHLRAHHRMWWGDDQIFLYELSVRCRPQTPTPATFQLQALEYGR
jgi:hypothetical protein